MISEFKASEQKSRGRALVVEDNPLIAMDTQTLLEDIGFSPVIVLSSLSAGHADFADHDFSFAILDVQIGDDACVKYAEGLAVRGARIVFASGYSDGEGLPPFFRNHVVIGKPYTKAQLMELLQS
ncbi:response regulator [Stappia stellulata]|uniref:response regulator n=1 Tax=Stappia stellulata TaxID=71235 RepID=UPI000490FD8F|nr:response regulator [Stappia stellulata]